MIEPSAPTAKAYSLHVLKLALSGTLDKGGEFYIKVLLPGGPERTQTIKSTPVSQWNKRYDFKSVSSFELVLEVKKKNLLRLNPAMGESRVSVGDLMQRCADDKESVLDLLHPRTKRRIGTIIVRLEPKAIRLRTFEGAQQSVTSLQSQLQAKGIGTSSLSDLGVVQAADNSKEILDQVGGTDALGGLISKLGKLRPESVKPLVDVLDEVSRIHPYVEGAWYIVSALYKVYQKKVEMDAEIVDLVKMMDDVLDFVNDTTVLRQKLKTFLETIEEVLRGVEECSNCIHRYLNTSLAGQTWLAFTEANQLNDFKSQFAKLSDKLNGAVVVHVAHGVSRLEAQQSEVITTLNRIEVTMLQAPSPASKALKIVVPPLPTDLFTGRDGYLKEMEVRFKFPKSSIELGKQRRYVLYGTGGIGKTQIALKFLDLNRKRFTAQYMIDASTKESIASSFEAIGHDAGISEPNVANMLRWFRLKEEEWALLFDNADNPDIDLDSFIPDTHHGNIIITTRNASYRRLAPQSHSKEVSILDEEAAINLLLQSAEIDDGAGNREAAQRIVKEFGYLALAIVQAGSYIATRGLDLGEYDAMYQSNRKALLKTALGPDLRYKQPVYTTWEISFAALSTPAQTMLNFCSFLYRESITEELFQRAASSEALTEDMEDTDSESDDSDDSEEHTPGPELKISPTTKSEVSDDHIDDDSDGDEGSDSDEDWDDEDDASPAFFDFMKHLRDDKGKWNKMAFVDLMHELRSYSLVQEVFKGVFNIHPLVHHWARERMEQSERDSCKYDAFHLIYYAAPEGDSINDLDVIFLRTLLPHMDFLGKPEDTEIADVFADAYYECGRWKDAEKLRIQVMKARKRELGREHEDTISAMRELALIWQSQGRLKEAAKLQTEALEISKRVLGDEDRDTLSCMNDLALTYHDQGYLEKAKKLQVEELEISQRVYGEDDSETLKSMGNLALTYLDQGQLDEAAKLQVKALDTTKRLFGDRHPDTITCLNNIALTYCDQGRLDEAAKVQLEVLEVSEAIWGRDHPDTLLSMDNLAWTYYEQDRLSEAEKLQVVVLDARRRILGREHQDTISTLNGLGLNYVAQGRLEEGLKLQIEEAELSRRVLGMDHPDTLTTLDNLASTNKSLGHLDEAIRLQIEAVEHTRRVLGVDHLETLDRGDHLASMYEDQGRLDEAIKVQLEVLEVSKRVLGVEHSDTLERQKTIESFYTKQRSGPNAIQVAE